MHTIKVVFRIFVLLVLLLVNEACAIPAEEWNKTFRNKYESGASSVQQTEDGGYVIAGYTSSYEGDAWLIKTDAKGNEQWNKTFKGEEQRYIGDWGRNQVYSVKQTSDNGYILAGYILAGHTLKYENEVPDYGVWLIKTDANGNEEWNKIIGGKGDEGTYYVQNTKDGGYIIAGYTESYGSGDDDAWLIKTDANGNEEWNKTFGGIGFDQAYSGEQTLDDGYILSGVTKSYYGGLSAWLIKTDAEGIEQWSQVFEKGSGDAYDTHQTTDGGYILTGSKEISGIGISGWPSWLIKTYANGNEQWNRTFLNQSARSVKQTKDGGYILAGGGIDAWLIKTDPNGNEQWNKTFGGTGDDYVSSIQQTLDGGYIIAGMTKSFGTGGSDAWLIKVGGEPSETTRVPTASPTEKAEETKYPIAVPTEKVGGFEVVLVIAALSSVYMFMIKRR